MDPSEIIAILNRHVFSNEKSILLPAIARYPDRFVGVFRSTTPRLKLIQNLLQSREIRFGDALEEIITGLIQTMGFVNLEKRFRMGNADDLSCDQYFCTSDLARYYLLEQKVRDDHDSTKKRGQVDNFRKKLQYLKSVHGSALVGIMYFIDPALRKNEGYYQNEITALRNALSIPIHLFYNGDLFQHLQGHARMWEVLLTSLQTWRRTIPEHIAPNFDAAPEEAMLELEGVPGSVWYKLLDNDSLWQNGILQALFPTGETLRLLEHNFRIRSSERLRARRRSASYSDLADLLALRLNQFYNK